MRANSPSAFFTSLTLHSVAAGLIVVFTYFNIWQQGPPPVIFELVAGPPTAPEELEAPALGNSPTPVKIETPPSEPAVIETVKPVAPPPPSEVVPPPPKPKAKTDTTLAKDLKKEMKKREKLSYKDYLKKHPAPKPAPVASNNTSNKKVPRIDAEGIAEGVKGGSKANKRGGGGGKALTREEQDELSTYISFLKSLLVEAYVSPPGMNDKLTTVVTIDITASGTILNPRITKSSGDREYDESVLDAFRRMRSLGPTPNGKALPNFPMAIRMSEEN